jgi:hexosaminidase
MQFYPPVKSIQYHQGAFNQKLKLSYHPYFTTQHNIKELKSFLNVDAQKEYSAIWFKKNEHLHEEAYTLEINQQSIIITSSTMMGQFWALKTLKQIVIQANNLLPCLYIEDEPVLKIRGYMLDISRGKIPKLKTIYKLIDLLSDIKMNHFQLYVEGFSYRYPSFDDKYFSNINALTVEDFNKIERYARAKNIDFVPCHNTFGHMTEWLKHDEFKHLAIMKDGMQMWGGHRPSSTINPLKEETHQFITKLLDDAILGSKSKYFNFCFDEAYELGHGDSKEACDNIGIEKVFTHYMLKIHHHLSSHKKQAMMWGDFFNDHPAALKQLPKDLIVIDWGYDHYYPFDERLKRLHENQIPFISSPGTSSWNSISGRTNDMIINIEKAIEFTKKYQGLGTLLTDWGDHGHIQHLIVSYPAIIYTAFESWSDHPGNLELTKSYLNRFVYEDQNQILGHLSFDIGTYYRHQQKYSSNGTELFKVLLKVKELKTYTLDAFKQSTQDISYSIFALKRIQSKYNLYLQAIKNVKSNKNMHHEVLAFKQTIQLVILLVDLLLASKLNNEKERVLNLKKVAKAMASFKDRHQKLWLHDNQPSGLSITLHMLEAIERLTQ